MSACFLIALFSQTQDEIEAARKARKTKIEDLRKQLASGKEGEKLGALAQLGEIVDEEAWSLLAARLNGDSATIRIAAAKAIAKHRKAASAGAIAAAIRGANLNDEPVVRGYLQALGDLDLCACIPHLVQLLETNKNALSNWALPQIARIGCPEAIKHVLPFLSRCEAEQFNPKNQNAKLVEALPQAKKTMAALAGLSYATAKEWENWNRTGGGAFKLASIYFCDTSNQTFDVASDGRKKCPYGDEKKGHTDTFLKHRKE